MHTIIHGDCLEELKKLDDNSVDAVITDPPYGLSNTKPAQVADVLKAWVTGDTVSVPAKRGGFMGKDWDSFVPPPAVWAECMRVLKPGGHMAVFAGARTQDLMGLSIRLAGFEIREGMGWIFGSGFPKSMDVSKAIDKKLDAKREELYRVKRTGKEHGTYGAYAGNNAVTAPATSEAQRWDGWGTALKPAIEPIILARKPLDGTVANNVLAHGVGGLNIDACRVGTEVRVNPPGSTNPRVAMGDGWNEDATPTVAVGRFPANVLLDEHAAKEMDKQSVGTRAEKPSKSGTAGATVQEATWKCWHKPGEEIAGYSDSGGASRFFPVFKSEEETPETKGRFPANVLLDEHAAKEMDEQSGVLKTGAWNGNRSTPKTDAVYGYREGGNESSRPADSGGASRFFPVFKYQAKAPKKERPVIYKNNCECEEWQSQQKDTTGSTATAETSWSMSTSGNSTMEKCQRDTTSTTSTMTSSTTGSKTSNALAGSTISESTQDAKSEMANGGNPAESAESLNQSEQNTGISAKRGGHSTDDAGHATSEKWYTTSECEKCGEPRLKVQHATVKPLALMEWLVSLIVPPGGVVLDPFAGSGTTLQAALNKGFNPIGIEQDADYIQLIHQRLEGGEQSTRSS